MRKSASLAVLAAALIAAGAAAADTPPEVYSDYAEDGVLSCGHSRAALKGVLNDASIHQYGDPYTLLGLKLAVRKQLAGGCRRQERAVLPIAPDAGGDEGTPGSGSTGEAGAKESSRTDTNADPKGSSSSRDKTAEALAEDEATSNQRDGWIVLLGVVLLLLTLGSGGWAARRAFTD